jgi:hypothetical protein
MGFWLSTKLAEMCSEFGSRLQTLGSLCGALRGVPHDARNNVTHWQSTNGTLGETDFDENDLLAVFDTSGSLIGSAPDT